MNALASTFWDASIGVVVGWAVLLFFGGVLFLTWIGYPLLLALWAWVKPPAETGKEARSPAALPRLTLIVAAHNEASSIAARLENALQLRYPAERWEIVVAEDGSNDATAEIVRSVITAQPASGTPRVRLFSWPERLGKAEALNRAVALSVGEVLVFSDANNLYQADVLLKLVEQLKNPRVGGVFGQKTVAERAGVGAGESVYWRYQRWVLRQEHRTGALVSGPGEIFAMRRRAFRPLPSNCLVNDDLYLLLELLCQGYQTGFAEGALSWELPSSDGMEEGKRRVRMTIGRLNALRLLWPQLRQTSLGVQWKLLCHEVLRVFSWLCMGAVLVSGAGLLWVLPDGAAERWWLWALLLGQLVFYLLAGGAALLRRLAPQRCWGPLEAPYFFCLAQNSCRKGFWQVLRAHWSSGNSDPRWHRVRRATPAKAVLENGNGFGLGATALAEAGASGAESNASVLPEGGAPRLETGEISPNLIVGGVAWAYGSFALGKVLVLGSVVLLARLLTPSDFGVVTLAMTTMAFLEILGSLGLHSALIYRQQSVERAAQTCFEAGLISALGQSAIAWWGAPWLAQFFHEPREVALLRALIPLLWFNWLYSTHDTLLRRRLSFQKKIIPDLGQAFSKAVASIVFALLHFGAWSLVWGTLVGAAFNTALLWKVTGWRPARLFSQSRGGAVFRQMFQYARHVYLMDVSGTVLANFDFLAVGRILGASLLGFYTIAFRLPDVLLMSLLNVLTRVMFPALSRLQDNREALQAALLQTIRYSAVFAVNVALAIALLARGLMLTLYGPRWLPSVPVMRVLALYAGLRCLTHHLGDAYKATGRPHVLSMLTVAWWALLPAALILGAHWGGIVGVAWAQLVVRLFMTLVHLYLAVRLLKIPFYKLWAAFTPSLETAAVLALTLWSMQHVAPALTPDLHLALSMFCGAGVFLVWTQLRYPALWLDARAMLRKRPAARAGEAVLKPSAAGIREAS